MRRAVLAAVVALAAVGSAAAPARAAADCADDGVASLCATAKASGDALALQYQIVQSDGPGTYSLYYVDTTTGTTSPSRAIGPLDYQQGDSGTFMVNIGHCYDVHLDSVPGTSLVVSQVCG